MKFKLKLIFYGREGVFVKLVSSGIEFLHV